MISQFFILSARGDTIINRDCKHFDYFAILVRQELIKNTPEIFFRNVKLYTGDAPPIFNIDGISFAYIKKSSGLYICATTRQNASPSFLIDILNKITKTLKDFCGVVTEEAIRKNFILIYEILDEMIDYGVPQLISTDQIKNLITSEPVLVKSLQGGFTPNIFKKNTVAPTASLRPVGKKNGLNNNEIFVDVIEKLSILFNASGYVINSSIEGCIQMKSYLNGNPGLKIGLNEDLVVGRSGIAGSVVLDDCNFNECTDISNFEKARVIKIKPPEGEFVVMNYRINSDFQAPFRIFPYIDEINNYKLEMELRIRACYPKNITCSYVYAKIPMPKLNSSVKVEIAKGSLNQTAEYKDKENYVDWRIKNFKGLDEITLRIKIALQQSQQSHNSRKEIGPISLNFEIPQFNVSNLQLKYLKIDDSFKDQQKIQRWVRVITQAASYVCRTT